MNMVIHDLRNPTTAINIGAKESLSLLKQQIEQYQTLKNYFDCIMKRAQQ